MEDILNEIIILNEKNKQGKKQKEGKIKKAKEKGRKQKEDKNNVDDIKENIESEQNEEQISILPIKRNKKTHTYSTHHSSNSSCYSISHLIGSNSTHNDTSTCCTIEDINTEKATIFSNIIKNKKERKDADIFSDLEKNINEKTPLFPNTNDINNNNNENNINSYLIQVDEINTNISVIYKNIDKINVLKKKIDLNIYDNEKLYKKVNIVIEQSEQIVEQIKKQINQLNAENDEYEKNVKLISEIKLRINIFLDTVNKYKSCINKYKNICNQYYEHINKNLIKRYKLINPNISSQALQKLLKQNNYDTFEETLNIENIYSNNLMNSMNVEQIEYEKMKQIYKELKYLEKNILSLNELYIELAYVIKKRKNLINSIENNVYQVKDYTEDALINIIEAKKYNKLIKQKIMYFSTFLLIVAFIVLFPILFNFNKF